MDLRRRHEVEGDYQESDDVLRDSSRLIVGVYASGLFDEASNYLINALGDVRALDILDYGCGTGETTRQLQERGASVVGLDISATRLAGARERVRGTGGADSSFVLGAGEVLPFPDAAFDAVLGKQVLHHLELQSAAREVARVLKPGGRAVFLEPLIHNPILQAYRRLTPQLRSSTERALSMGDLQVIGARFSQMEHREFCFLAVLPVLIATVLRRQGSLRAATRWLQKADRAMSDTVPALGRFYWETVLVLIKER